MASRKDSGRDRPPPDALVPLGPGGPLSTLLAEDRERAREVRKHLRAGSTLTAYDRAWRAWAAWCQQRGVDASAAPDEDVCAYLAWLVEQRATPLECRKRDGVKRPATGGETIGISSVLTAYSAIAMAYRHAGVPGWQGARATPVLVKEQIDALRRTVGVAPKRPKEAATLSVLRKLVATFDRSTLAGKRDAAILLVHWFLCDRRSDTIGLDAADIVPIDGGARATIRKSKGDQEGRGLPKGLVTARRDRYLCPTTALGDWMSASGITDGPIWRALDCKGRVTQRRLHARHVSDVVKAAARAAGFDEARVVRLASHSCRSGFITEAVTRGVDLITIAQQSGHKSLDTLKGYAQRANVVRNNPAKGWT